jgi:hypothetical protein
VDPDPDPRGPKTCGSGSGSILVILAVSSAASLKVAEKSLDGDAAEQRLKISNADNGKNFQQNGTSISPFDTDISNQIHKLSGQMM